MKNQTQTPMMQQFYACKEKAKDALLLFRLGDFYECFGEDAKTLSDALNVTLTKRHDIPMSGIPAHTLETHLHTLIKKNHVVAIAEQTTLEGDQKGLIKRDVVRIESPATYYESTLLNAHHNFFAAALKINSTYAICLVDISTGECFVQQEDSFTALIDELYKQQPKELLLPRSLEKEHKESFKTLTTKIDCKLHFLEHTRFSLEKNYTCLLHLFHMQTLDAFGLKSYPACINAAGELLSYLKDILYQEVGSIEKISLLHANNTLALDQCTLLNLEVLCLKNRSSITLLKHLDQCQTPMGSRLLSSWLSRPSLCISAITKRQEGVALILQKEGLLKTLIEILKPIRDIQRFIKRIQSDCISPRDLYALVASLQNIDSLDAIIKQENLTLPSAHSLHTRNLTPLCKKTLSLLDESAATKTQIGGIFKPGAVPQIDALLKRKNSAKETLLALQNKYQKELGIKSLKIHFNNAFGYFIQIPRSQSQKIPSNFEKKQSLINSERFICPELKEYELQILTSQEKIEALEKERYQEIKKEFAQVVSPLSSAAKTIGYIDAIAAFAVSAIRYNYKKPILNDKKDLVIQRGRHPLVESLLEAESFITNDTTLNEKERLHIITGPNMGGKSTYIKQIALIVIMAQAGSFVPAEYAQIGIVDKIFSRIGANDDLSRGQSTFMIEMSETANILHNTSDKSLVILDEVGRGTSTFDGIAIARAVTEHLFTLKAKTLFATHYFELSELEKTFDGIKNYHALVHEGENGITFLHKIKEGSANKSYAIHVAKLSGMPQKVLDKASSILQGFHHAPPEKPKKKQEQLTLFAHTDKSYEVIKDMKKLRLEVMTPLEALEKLYAYKKILD